MRAFFVYIAASKSGTLYVGVTNSLERRMAEHRAKAFPGFTAQYNITKLVYYEEAPDPLSAITREKQLKGWRRSKKVKLIQRMNPQWTDLASQWGLPERPLHSVLPAIAVRTPVGMTKGSTARR